MKTIKDLSDSVFYNMHNYSQMIIDLVQEAERLFTNEESTSEDFGALGYLVDLVLEIIDPTRSHDVEVLHSLAEMLNTKIESFK